MRKKCEIASRMAMAGTIARGTPAGTNVLTYLPPFQRKPS